MNIFKILCFIFNVFILFTNHNKTINATKVQIMKPVSDTVTELVQGSVLNDSVEDCIIKHSCKNCGACYEGFSKDQAQKFLDTHSKKHLNKCPQCSKTFIEVSQLLNHIRIYHKQYNCDHCRFITLIKSEMIEHLALKHTEKKRFMCKGCYKQHQNLSELKRHVCKNDQTGLCQYCGYKSKNLNSLRWHVRTYHTERNFVCSICNKSMATQVGLTLHMHHHENPRPKISGYICDVCGKHFKEKSALKLHMVTHTGEKPLKCSVCGTRFAKRETLRQHLLTHTGKRPYSCDICGKRFVQKPALTCHRKSHPGDHPPLPKVYIDSYIKEVDPSMVHDFTVPVPELKIESKTFLDFSSKCRRSVNGKRLKKGHKCIKCNAHFSHMTKLVVHLKNEHRIENAFKCDECGKTFKTPMNIRRHKLIHTGNKQFTCDICSYASNQKSNVDQHKKRHFKEFGFKCKICEKGFVVKAELVEHENIHVNQKFKCKICNKKYSYKRNLTAHMNTYHPSTLKENYQCHLCPEKFISSLLLQNHKKKHKNKRTLEFLCELCGTRVSSKKALEIHERRHTGEKIVSCNICKKGFSCKANLKIHQRVHTGEKPYTCNECGKDFTQRTSLIIHLRYHTGERPYWCTICARGFVAKNILTKHQQIHD